MNTDGNELVRDVGISERKAWTASGILVLVGTAVLFLAYIAAIIATAASYSKTGQAPSALLVGTFVVSGVLLTAFVSLLPNSLKILGPNEAIVLTVFGKYYGTVKTPGFFFVNPFNAAVAPESSGFSSGKVVRDVSVSGKKRISLKTMTLNNEKQKINDLMGNPIEISVVVVWRVVDTVKAVFNVDNYPEFLSIQCDSVLREVVTQYPYDLSDMGVASNEQSLRGSSEEISGKLRVMMQKNVEAAGLEIVDVKITSLAYATEIAAVMLQRQQATALIAARQMIVDGAVGMVEMALARLNESNVVELDEERKAAMVSNLLVVLCAGKEAQPVVNSGSIY